VDCLLRLAKLQVRIVSLQCPSSLPLSALKANEGDTDPHALAGREGRSRSVGCFGHAGRALVMVRSCLHAAAHLAAMVSLEEKASGKKSVLKAATRPTAAQCTMCQSVASCSTATG
jgi:hypothetical protein